MKEKTNKKQSASKMKRHFPAAAVLFAAFLIFCLFPETAEANFISDGFKWAINHIIYGFFVFFSWLLGAIGVLFGWIIEPNNMYLVIDSPAIYESWKMVRDLLNIAFILVLLFSAFCTIFQVEKYHLKKLLLMVVIMALLVNFSFPISRFIIDVSNLAFYFILNSMFQGKSGEGIMAGFGNFSGLVDILTPEKIDSDTSTAYLISMAVFTLILAVTFGVLAIMFVIRLTVLGVLIIFSPVGFVAAIFPSTKHLADKWWSNLFNYSFFAPIMIFMMATAFRIMHSMSEQSALNSFMKQASKNVPTGNMDPNFFGSIAFFAIPVVILWTGLIVSRQLSIAGAGIVVDRAKRGTGQLLGVVTRYNSVRGQVAAFRAARKKRQDEKGKDRFGGKVGDVLNRKQDEFISKIGQPFGLGKKAAKRVEKMRISTNREAIESKSKEHEGTKAPVLVADIDVAIETPAGTATKDKQIEAAGKVKQAFSRRNEFEKAIEERIKNDIVNRNLVPPLPITPSPTAPDFAALGLVVPDLSADPTSKEIEDRNDIIREREKLQRQFEKEKEKWEREKEKAERDFIQEQKAIFIENARKIIADAETAK